MSYSTGCIWKPILSWQYRTGGNQTWETLRKTFLSTGVRLLSPLLLSEFRIHLLVSAELLQTFTTVKNIKRDVLLLQYFPIADFTLAVLSSRYPALALPPSALPQKSPLPAEKMWALGGDPEGFLVPGSWPHYLGKLPTATGSRLCSGWVLLALPCTARRD